MKKYMSSGGVEPGGSDNSEVYHHAGNARSFDGEMTSLAFASRMRMRTDQPSTKKRGEKHAI